ncbi:hypothetical protein FRB94_011543 [Tulasnella sp. JGI-2019a]|nr:hypothetical protein FRB93_010027 [Tulasnella sp. JGI-2019a]KAG8992496.1 hypothetical protein FRB94_011543 [Tulasnella sp. JGI-2019a]
MSVELSYPNGRIRLIHPPPPSDDYNTHLLYTHPHTLKHLPIWSLETQSLEKVASKRQARTLDPDHFKEFVIHRIINITDTNSNPRTDHSVARPPVFLGTVGFVYMQRHFDTSELGIVLQPDAHRCGYAAEAVYLLLDHGFTPEGEGGIGLNRVVFTTAAMNVPMRGWLENALGATQESMLREAWKTGEGYIDAIGYSILRREWVRGVRANLAARVDRAISKSRES